MKMSTFKEELIAAVAEGCNTLQKLYERFGGSRTKGCIRGTVNKAVKRGELIRRGNTLIVPGRRGPLLPRNVFTELSNLSLVDLMVIFSLRGRKLSTGELADACGASEQEVLESVQVLMRCGFVSNAGNAYKLTAKGAFLSAFLYVYYYLIAGSDGEPSYEDGEGLIWELSHMLSNVAERRDAIVRNLEMLERAVTAASDAVVKLSKLLPSSDALKSSERVENAAF